MCRRDLGRNAITFDADTEDMEMMQQRTKAIKATLTEHMESYALIGFDLDGNQVCITHTPTDRDFLAVDKAFQNWYDETYSAEPIEALCEWETDDEDN